MKKQGLFFTLAAMLLWSVHCSNKSPTVAGGEDFPNSMTVGKALSEGMAAGPEWDQFRDVPDTVPDIIGSDSIANAFGNAGKSLAKQAGAGAISDSFSWNLADSGQGVVTVYHLRETYAMVRRDTLTVLYDDSARDSKTGNETVLRVRGRIEGRNADYSFWYQYADADSNGSLDSAAVYKAVSFAGGFSIQASFSTSNDGHSFAVPTGIKTYCLQSYSLRNGDTLLFRELRDLDNDGKVVDPLITSNRVLVTDMQRDPVQRPYLSLLFRRVKGNLKGAGFRKFRAQHFLQKTVDKTGQASVITVNGKNTDSTFNTNDTAWVRIRQTRPNKAFQDTVFSAFRITLGDSVSDGRGHRMISYEVQKQSDIDSLRSVRYSFTARSPVSADFTGADGNVEMQAVMRSGSTFSFSGTLSKKGVLTGTYVDPDGKRYSITWEKDKGVTGSVLAE